jgi:group I intron endonuclease
MRFNIPYTYRNSSGIYAILNEITCKVYVGSAVNFTNRYKQYIRKYKAKKSHSIKLLNTFNKHGIDNFSFILLEACEKNILYDREQSWINKFNSSKTGYNTQPLVGSSKGVLLSEETKIKIAVANSGANNKNSKPVMQYTRDGAYLRTYASTGEAARLTGFTQGLIMAACSGNRKHHKGFLWKFEKSKKKIIPLKPLEPILQYDTEGNLLNKFLDINEAHKTTKIKWSGIHTALNNRRKVKQAGGYMWRYEKENPGDKILSLQSYPHALSKKVYQFDLKGALVGEYIGLKNASQKTGLTMHNISVCLIKRSRTAGGFLWSYDSIPPLLRPKKTLSKKVIQMCKDGTPLAQYESTCDASRKTGFYQSGISNACTGKVKTCCGFIWKYAGAS